MVEVEMQNVEIKLSNPAEKPCTLAQQCGTGEMSSAPIFYPIGNGQQLQ